MNPKEIVLRALSRLISNADLLSELSMKGSKCACPVDCAVIPANEMILISGPLACRIPAGNLFGVVWHIRQSPILNLTFNFG
jgi:hypothetical protein